MTFPTYKKVSLVPCFFGMGIGIAGLVLNLIVGAYILAIIYGLVFLFSFFALMSVKKSNIIIEESNIEIERCNRETKEINEKTIEILKTVKE